MMIYAKPAFSQNGKGLVILNDENDEPIIQTISTPDGNGMFKIQAAVTGEFFREVRAALILANAVKGLAA